MMTPPGRPPAPRPRRAKGTFATKSAFRPSKPVLPGRLPVGPSLRRRLLVSARISVAALAALIALATPVLASDEGYIYGRVLTSSGDSYEGQIRWGTEESFWDDMFNADKASNDNLDYVSRHDLNHVRSRHWGSLLGIGDMDLTHVLAVRFGDLKRIEVRGGERAIAEFRNGEEMELRGGSNDIGARITVVDSRRGRQEIGWRHIRSIEFEDTPSRLE